MLQRHESVAFAGSIHFVTTVTGVRGNWFQHPDHCRGLLELFEGYRAKFSLECYGYVLMPDHLHALLRQQTEESVVPLLMEGFKSVSARTLKPQDYPGHRLWAQRYDDVPIPGREAALTRIEYMHNNPVKRELVRRPEDYEWSSARFLIGLGESIVRVESA